MSAQPPLANPLDFTGRSVVVTGGSRGLGRVLATRFLDAGAEVITCARNFPDKPVTSTDGSNEAGFVAADVRDPEQVRTVVNMAIDQYGRIDVLVNNAGGAPLADSADVSPRFNEKIIALNLTAPLTFCQGVYPTMSAQDGGGVIINISSVSGTRPNPRGVAYGAAKAGLENMTRTLAHEWGPDIRVVAVTVGMIITDVAHDFYGDRDRQARVAANLPAGRLGQPADVSDMCLVLASPLAKWVTGTCVEVHGGGEGPAYLKTVGVDGA
ncbi:MAG: SDR family oxidoreductase [Acidimicrobiales bacterium]|nr:SDR family oxidoreductase [Acidimicrobiales bacterium]